MPEGPEVKRNADLLGQLLIGRFVDGLTTTSGKLHTKGIPGAENFYKGFVTRVRAHGKLLRVTFDHGGELTSTLGMSGWWYPGHGSLKAMGDEKAYVNGRLVPIRDVVAASLKYKRVSLSVAGEDLAVYTDMRNFGNMEYWPNGLPEAELKRRIGLDLLNELPHMLNDIAKAAAYMVNLRETASKRLLNMKMGDLALQQDFIAGLGNIYRAETFWLTGINPHLRLKELSTDDWLKFCETAMVVLQIAYRFAGSMRYPADLLESLTGANIPTEHRGHLAYGRTHDIFNRRIVRDDAFARPLWRLETA